MIKPSLNQGSEVTSFVQTSRKSLGSGGGRSNCKKDGGERDFRLIGGHRLLDRSLEFLGGREKIYGLMWWGDGRFYHRLIKVSYYIVILYILLHP